MLTSLIMFNAIPISLYEIRLQVFISSLSAKGQQSGSTPLAYFAILHAELITIFVSCTQVASEWTQGFNNGDRSIILLVNSPTGDTGPTGPVVLGLRGRARPTISWLDTKQFYGDRVKFTAVGVWESFCTHIITEFTLISMLKTAVDLPLFGGFSCL